MADRPTPTQVRPAGRPGRAPLTIKGVSADTRNAIARGAAQRGVAQGAYLDLAISNQRLLDTRETILPPADLGTPDGRPAPVIPGGPIGHTALADLVSIAQAVQALAAAKAAGLPVSDALFRETAGLLRDRERAHRGLAPLRHRARVGQTTPAIGQTGGGDG